jgi:dihydroorotate dehydrogenase electron transfer subunit
MNRDGTFAAYRIQFVRIENKSTRTLVFDAPMIGVQPGQYVMAWLPGIGEKPFSISGDDPLALTVADVGKVSHALTCLEEGDRVWVRGPLGRGFSLISGSYLLVGGGYGAAPLGLLAQRARGEGHDVKVALGARTESDLLMCESFEAIGCQVFHATEDGSAGLRGLVTDALAGICSDWKPGGIYACGPMGMLMAVAAFARERRLPAQLSFEGLIRCGIGLCGSCELPESVCNELGISPGFLVCHDGPVVKC